MDINTLTHDVIWESVVDITRKVQNQALSSRSLEELLLVMLDSKLLVDKKEFSVVYQEYGAEIPRFLIIEGEVVDKDGFQTVEPFSVTTTCILDIIHQAGSKPLYLSTNKECIDYHFPDQYKSILIAPMRLHEQRNIGVFLAHSQSREHAFTGLEMPFDALSDHIAFYLRSNVIGRRSDRFRTFHNNLLKTPYTKESEIIAALVTKLNKWFTNDKIHILLANPFNTDEYLFACNNGEIIEEFRTKPSWTEVALKYLVGDTLPIIKERPLILNSVEEIKQHGIDSSCKSWLGARMQTYTDQYIGFIILENFVTEHSYEVGEETLVDDVSDFVALVLTGFRRRQREKSLLHFNHMLLGERLPSDAELYEMAQNELNDLYGSVSLAIVRTNRTTRKLELIKNSANIENFELNNEFAEALAHHIEEKGKVAKAYLSAQQLSIIHPVIGKILAFPMRSGGDKLGCFIIPSAKCGPLTTRYIDDLSDTVAAIMDKQDKENVRLDLLSQLGSQIPHIKLTQEEIVKVAHKYVANAMFSENLYVALYNKEKNEISFPFIIKNGQPWNQSSRQLNKMKRGKTEEIILTGTPILHKTKAESRAWYEHPGHEEFAGDPLASWIGVPIFSPDGVIGVIAAYHPDEEFVYSQGDLFFLQMLSHPVSGLFRALALEEALINNTALKEANKKISHYESQLQANLNARDITHRIKGSLGSISILAKKTIKSLKYNVTQQNGNIVDDLEQIEETSNLLLKTASDMASNEKEEIRVFPLLEKIVKQASTEYHVSNIRIISPSKNIITKQDQRSLFHAIYALLGNACDAVSQDRSPLIEIYVENFQDSFKIIIKDNGAPIDKEVEDKIFDLGFTTKQNGQGYALWRAKNFAQNNGGDLVFYRENEFKCFCLSLPSVKNKLLAYIVDDQKIWRNILSDWLENMGYKSEATASFSGALRLLEQDDTPNLILLDVALDFDDSGNFEGLELIGKIKDKFIPSPKIVLVTGFPDVLERYLNDVDLVLPKVDASGHPLDEEEFFRVINGLGK